MTLVFVSIHIEEAPRAVPLGPAMLASMLKGSLVGELRTDILNLYLNQSATECAEMILRAAPDYVGFSLCVWNRNLTMAIASILKQRRPDIVLFAGGPEASADCSGMLTNGMIDFVLSGECEEIIVPAMEHLLSGGDPQKTSEVVSPAPVRDISVLPSPFLDQTLDPKDYGGMLWELSRGCPFKCDFCYESRGAPGIRRFPIDRIRDELRLFRESGVDQIFVLDPTFNHDKRTAKRMLRLIHDEAPEIYYFFEVRSESIDAEMAELFASVDCSLQIGLQSASCDVLKRINRTIHIDDFENKIFLLHEANVAYGFDLIYGLPGDTLDGFCASFDFALGLVPNHVDIFPLAVLPGTRLQETAPSFGLEYQPSAPYQVLSSPEFSAEDMTVAAGMAHAFELFYNQGKAVPWFAIVVNALELTPSEFIRRFAGWLKDKPEAEVLSLQTGFVADMLDQSGGGALTELAIDIVTYFGRFEFLCNGETVVPFNHNPVDLLDRLEDGVTDLKALSRLLPRSPCSASLRINDSGGGTILIR